MIKTITIDGKQVTFKSNGATPMRYKAQFGRDFMKDVVKMAPIAEHAGKDDISLEVIEMIDFEVFSNILWVFAKTADPQNVPDPLAWLDQFDEFPVFDLFEDVQDLVMNNFETSKKK